MLAYTLGFLLVLLLAGARRMRSPGAGPIQNTLKTRGARPIIASAAALSRARHGAPQRGACRFSQPGRPRAVAALPASGGLGPAR